MVECSHLCAGFGQKSVLKDLSLTIPDGKVTVLLGPNGSGKSTLLRTVMGLADLHSGQIRIDGADRISLSPRDFARKAAYLPQNRPVPGITARTLVLHGRFPYMGYPRRYTTSDRAIADEALAKVGAADYADEPLTALSGGQIQRVYIAMTLAQDTRNVLLDEPASFLDVNHQLELMALIRSLAGQGKAVALVLHDLCLAMRFADRIAVISGGSLAACGTPEEIFEADVCGRVFGIRLRRLLSDGQQRYYID